MPPVATEAEAATPLSAPDKPVAAVVPVAIVLAVFDVTWTCTLRVSLLIDSEFNVSYEFPEGFRIFVATSCYVDIL
jgi:hypothetical protein